MQKKKEKINFLWTVMMIKEGFQDYYKSMWQKPMLNKDVVVLVEYKKVFAFIYLQSNALNM